MQQPNRTTQNPQNRSAVPQGNRTLSAQARAASIPTNKPPVTQSAGSANLTESTSKNAVVCRKCKSTQIVGNKRGYSFSKMFLTFGLMIGIGVLLLIIYGILTEFMMSYGFFNSPFSNAIFIFIGTTGILSISLALLVSILVGFVGRSEIVNGCMSCGFKWAPAKKK